MATQKCINYNPLNMNGELLDFNSELRLNVLETSGNYVLHRDLLRYFNSQKQGTSSTKTRSEVRGGGKKPWRQKGTGRARAGSNRSPLWKGGGVIFGPKPKKITFKLNKKERRLALQTVLYNKKNYISIIDNLEDPNLDPKTKKFETICEKCNISLKEKILVIVSIKTQALKLATRNLKEVELISASNLNTLSLLKAKQVICTPLAINNIQEVYCD